MKDYILKHKFILIKIFLLSCLIVALFLPIVRVEDGILADDEMGVTYLEYVINYDTSKIAYLLFGVGVFLIFLDLVFPFMGKVFTVLVSFVFVSFLNKFIADYAHEMDEELYADTVKVYGYYIIIVLFVLIILVTMGIPNKLSVRGSNSSKNGNKK